MVTVEHKLQDIRRELTTITLAIQKIVDINHFRHNSQYELLKDLLHILNTAKDVLDTILRLSDED